jgi:hypothetical protein
MATQHDVYGGTVTLRDPKDVPERLRRPVIKRMTDLVDIDWNAVPDPLPDDATDEQKAEFTAASQKGAKELSYALDGMNDLNDVQAVAMIESWSFPQAITVDGLLDLPSASYREILELVAPLVTELMPSFGASPEPNSPTVAS